jgi:hypothetical protein
VTGVKCQKFLKKASVRFWRNYFVWISEQEFLWDLVEKRNEPVHEKELAIFEGWGLHPTVSWRSGSSPVAFVMVRCSAFLSSICWSFVPRNVSVYWKCRWRYIFFKIKRWCALLLFWYSRIRILERNNFTAVWSSSWKVFFR